MAYTLPDLPYAYNALEPYIDEETMHYHHDKHHQTYVNNLNGAVEKHPELFNKSAEELITDLTAIPAMSAISKNPDGVGYEGIGAMSANAYEGMAHAHAIAAARANEVCLLLTLSS